jgi:hypothetical protein
VPWSFFGSSADPVLRRSFHLRLLTLLWAKNTPVAAAVVAAVAATFCIVFFYFYPILGSHSGYAIIGFFCRGAYGFDTSLPPTDWDSTVPEKTINPYIRADENDIKTWPSF